MLAQHLPETFQLELTWAGVESMTFFSSLSMTSTTASQKLNREKLWGALVVAGDFEVVEQRIAGQELYITRQRMPEQQHDWRFTMQDFADLAANIIQAERDYFTNQALLEAGILSASQYETIVRETRETLANNPAKNASNEALAEQLEDLIRLPIE